MRQVGRIFGKKRKGVTALEISPDGARLIVGLRDETARLVDPRSRRILHILSGHRGEVGDVSFSPDGAVVATMGIYDRTVRLWSSEDAAPLWVVEGQARYLNAVAFSPLGDVFAAAGPGKIHVWSTDTGEPQWTVEALDFISGVGFTPDGATVVAGDNHGNFRFTAVATGEKTLDGKLVPSSVTAFAIARTRDLMVIAYFWRTDPMEVGESIASKLALYDLASGSVTAELDGGDFAYNDLAFAPDEKTMVAGRSDGLIDLIDLGSRTTVRTLEGHPGQVTSVAAHPDGTMVVSGDSGGQVLFWRDD